MPGCLAQVRGPAGVLGRRGRPTTPGRSPSPSQVPAGATPFVRAEVRRPAQVVVDPTAGSTAPMVALTNPVFLGAATSAG